MLLCLVFLTLHLSLGLYLPSCKKAGRLHHLHTVPEEVSSIISAIAPLLTPAVLIYVFKTQNDASAKDLKTVTDVLSKDLKTQIETLSKELKTVTDSSSKDLKTQSDALTKDIKLTESLLNKLILYTGKKNDVDLDLFLRVERENNSSKASTDGGKPEI
jgi:hypothetical protein